MPPSPYEAYIQQLMGEGIAVSDLAQLKADDLAQRSRAKAAISALFGDLGVVPGGFKDPFGAAEAGGALAARNPFSTMKQIARQREKARGSLYANRAARGVVMSGGTALGEDDIGFNTGLQQYQAIRDAMSQVGDISSQYADDQRQRLGQYPGIYEGAQDRLMQAGYFPKASPRRKLRPPSRPGPRLNGGPLIGVGQGSGPYIGTRP